MKTPCQLGRVIHLFHRRRSQQVVALWFAMLGGLAAAPEPAGSVRFEHSIAAVSVAGTAPGSKEPVQVRALTLDETEASLPFVVALRLRDADEFQARVARGERVPAAEVEQKYLPLPADIERVRQWIENAGLEVTQVPANRLTVFVRAPVRRVAAALQTRFARVAFEGREYSSAVTAPVLPKDLAPLVLGLHGLQPHIRPRRQLQPHATVAAAGPYYPAQVARAYHANNLGLTGAGQTIAVFAGAFPTDSDLTTFWRASGVSLALDRIERVPVHGGPASDADEGLRIEATLDVQWLAALAPAARIRIYGFDESDPVGWDGFFQQVYADLTDQPGMHQCSISFGTGESDSVRDYVLIIAQYTALLANAGVTVFASSGDEAANVGGRIQASLPASDPNVTGVGGTSLTLDASGAVATESAWSGSGGGTSRYILQPPWQVGQGVPPSSPSSLQLRSVPDVAALGDPNTGVAIVFNGATRQIGGTSISAPIWAAFCALLNESRANRGQTPLGHLNRRLYPLLGTAAFRDITTGSNGYTQARVGYDTMTGLGVPDIARLRDVLDDVPAAPAFVRLNVLQQFTTIGQSAAFTVAVVGSAPLMYRWQRQPGGMGDWLNLDNNANFQGVDTPNLSVRAATYDLHGDQYRCVVSNVAGSVTSTSMRLLVFPYGVSTLAGWPGAQGTQDGIGREARFSYPGSVRVDRTGNVIVADGGNHTVRLITPAGVVTTLAGAPGVSGSQDGPAADARFFGIGGVAPDGNDNIYIADSGNGTIRRLSAAGVVTTIAGLAGDKRTVDGPGAEARFADPQNLAVDGQGNIYVADGVGHTIRKISANGVVSTLAGAAGQSGLVDGAADVARFNKPTGVAVDTAGNVFVADKKNNRVRKISPTGTVSTLPGSSNHPPSFATPAGVAVDTAGNVYVVCEGDHTVEQIKPDGTSRVIAGMSTNPESTDGPVSEPGGDYYGVDLPIPAFNYPADIAVDKDGTLYVGDGLNNTVRRIARGILQRAKIVTSPVSQTVVAGQKATFSITATGSEKLRYQWYGPGNRPLLDDGVYAGTQTPSLSISSTSLWMHYTDFYCVAANSLGSQQSGSAQLYVQGPPVFNFAPSAIVLPAGSTYTLTIPWFGNSGSSFNVIWRFNRGPLPDVAGRYNYSTSGLDILNFGAAQVGSYSVIVSNQYGTVEIPVGSLVLGNAPTISAPPVGRTAGVGEQAALFVGTPSTAGVTFQWSHDGQVVPNATTQSLSVAAMQPADAGVYIAGLTGPGGNVSSAPAILGFKTVAKVTGAAAEVGSNIRHANGNIYDQVLLQGPIAAVTANPGEVVRISYVDLSNDIVQVEFSGLGTLTLTLDNASGPAPAENYRQPGVNYMKGHARIVIAGANETTNVSVFSVGRGTAIDQSLFRDDIAYDGVADLASIAINTVNGKFGGLRMANASFSGLRGLVGVFAPGVEFTGPVFIGDIDAFDSATPVLILRSATETRVAGGDLLQSNGRAVEVTGLRELRFTAGTTSHNREQPAQANKARLIENGIDVSAEIVRTP